MSIKLDYVMDLANLLQNVHVLRADFDAGKGEIHGRSEALHSNTRGFCGGLAAAKSMV